MEKGAFVIPRSELEKVGFIPPEGQSSYTCIENLGDLRKLITVAYSEGLYMERNGEAGAEDDRSVQQVIMYGFVTKPDGSFLLYQRSQGEGYSESRLAGKVSIGIGGHMEPTDLSLAKSFYRELDEEAEVLVDGNPVSFRDGDGNLRLPFMKRFVHLSPVGLIKDERDDVGKVHFGIVCRIVPNGENIEVRVKTGDGEENINSQYLTADQYLDMLASGQVEPEGWTEIVLRKEVFSRLDLGPLLIEEDSSNNPSV